MGALADEELLPLLRGPRCRRWREVQASAGLRFDFYLCTRHVCAHYMKVKLNLPTT